MSRYTCTLRWAELVDTAAAIGWDPPLRTYFLQGFADRKTGYARLWLGTRIGEFPKIEDIEAEAHRLGFAIDPLPAALRRHLQRERRRHTPPSLGERIGIAF